jgi:hypothetical protein
MPGLSACFLQDDFRRFYSIIKRLKQTSFLKKRMTKSLYTNENERRRETSRLQFSDLKGILILKKDKS